MNSTFPTRSESSQLLRSSWQPFFLYAALLALSFGLCGAAYAFFPELRPKLVIEDGVIENLSIAFYLLGVAISVFALASRSHRFRGMKVLIALCVLGVLEEISYGQRLFPGLVFPTLPSGMTFDALHDSGRIVVKGFEALGVPWYAGFLLSALLVTGAAALLLRRRLPAIIQAVSEPRSVWLYVALAAGLAVIALFVDSRGYVPRKWVLLEEVLEMNAALSLAFAAGIGVFFARHIGRLRDTDREGQAGG